MTQEKIKSVLEKLFNSPLITKKFPFIDRVDIREVEERMSFPDSVIVRVTLHIKEVPKSPLLMELDKYCLDLLKTLGIGGNYNYIYYNYIESDDTI